jgi:hypothetical protein
MVRLNLKGSKLMGLLEGWLAAAERDRHISFVKQLLQVKGGKGWAVLGCILCDTIGMPSCDVMFSLLAGWREPMLGLGPQSLYCTVIQGFSDWGIA